MTDTIFAQASGHGRAGVAVIRVSGPLSSKTFEVLTGDVLPQPRMAALVALRGIDRAIALYFKNPASFTGEDVMEYHVHGGRAVVDGVLKALGKIDGCRLAGPGEFTRRAFENGKMDLTEAEAVADLIAAETEAQRAQALVQLEGGLSRIYSDWTARLAAVLAHQEADIEFPEEDMPAGIAQGLKPEIAKLKTEIAAHLNDARRGERLRDGALVAILGAPNAGKSSLLNALARRDAAIVSAEAGTTRDIIEVHLDLGGYPVILADTAGLREAAGAVEAEGIRRARDLAVRADLKIILFDSAGSAGFDSTQDEETLKLVDEKTLVVFTKADIASSPSPPAFRGWERVGVRGAVTNRTESQNHSRTSHPPHPGLLPPTREERAGGEGEEIFRVSSLTGAGMDGFLTALTEKVAAFFGRDAGPSPTRARHRSALEEALSCLVRCEGAVLPELAAEDLRLALRALGSITGRVHVEDLLDRIFRDFCIGK